MSNINKMDNESDMNGKSTPIIKPFNLNAPEFNPSHIKSTGKLNVDAPEFVPGQLNNTFDNNINTIIDNKNKSYKNGRMSNYNRHHVSQIHQHDHQSYMHVWVPSHQSYRQSSINMGIPYQQQLYPRNRQYDYINYNYNRQSNYTPQRNVYNNTNDYIINQNNENIINNTPLQVPYNAVVTGNLPKNNNQPIVDDGNNTVNNDIITEEVKQKPLTWAERTKLSTRQPKITQAEGGLKRSDGQMQPQVASVEGHPQGSLKRNDGQMQPQVSNVDGCPQGSLRKGEVHTQSQVANVEGHPQVASVEGHPQGGLKRSDGQGHLKNTNVEICPQVGNTELHSHKGNTSHQAVSSSQVESSQQSVSSHQSVKSPQVEVVQQRKEQISYAKIIKKAAEAKNNEATKLDDTGKKTKTTSGSKADRNKIDGTTKIVESSITTHTSMDNQHNYKDKSKSTPSTVADLIETEDNDDDHCTINEATYAEVAASTEVRPAESSSIEVQSNSFRPAVSSSNYLSLKGDATPGDRGEQKVWIRPQVEPAADLREAKGEVNREAVCKTTSGGTPSGRPQVESRLQDNERTTSGKVNVRTKKGGDRQSVSECQVDTTSSGTVVYGDNKPHNTEVPHDENINPHISTSVNPEERETTDITSSVLPEADLREAEGEVNREGPTPSGMEGGEDNAVTSGGGDNGVEKCLDDTLSTSVIECGNEYSVQMLLGIFRLLTRERLEKLRESSDYPNLIFSCIPVRDTSSKSSGNRGVGDDRMNNNNNKNNNNKNDHWRHSKSYNNDQNKSFGTNFKFSNKEFTRDHLENVHLHTASESSWVIRQAKQKLDKEDMFRRKIMGLLNRLTFEKFDIIYDQIISCGIDTPEHALMLVKFVFGKAVTQHHFIPMYVELCAKLAVELYDIDYKDPDLVINDTIDDNNNTQQQSSSSIKSGRKSDFMRILLNCSQDSFENNLKPLTIPEELEGDDKFEYEQKYKHKMRGNMIFVGELFKQKLLAAKLLITCLDQVFSKREECVALYNDINMGNNHLEAMCTLLQTVGRSFDTNRWKHLAEFEKRIQLLAELGKNEDICFRIRCLIKNVLDCRQEKWDKQFGHKIEGPCKLQELRSKVQYRNNNYNSKSTNSHDESWRNRRKSKVSSEVTKVEVPVVKSSDISSTELKKSIRSIVSELILSHDPSESTLCVTEMNLPNSRDEEMFNLILMDAIELCAKITAVKERSLVTKWLSDLSVSRSSQHHLISCLKGFVLDSVTENCYENMIEDYPVLPSLLNELIGHMETKCSDNVDFQNIQKYINGEA